MPIEEYFKGRGREVMRKMKKRYGGDGGERAFYATANKQGQKPKQGRKRGTKRGSKR